MYSTILIPATHPSLPGHFPGRAVVPGAVILAEIAHAAGTFSGGRVTAFVAVKFTRPMLPDQACDLSLTDKDGGTVAFELQHAGQRVVSGQLRYARIAAES